MKKIIAVLALSSLGLAALPAMADQYTIDTRGAHASINFKVNHLGFSWLVGRFNEFGGDFTYDSENLSDSTINVTINTRSVDSNHSERDRHLRNSDFLDVSKFPEAKFVSTKVIPGEGDKFQVVGDLTLHGVTRSITIDAEKIGEGEDPWGGHRVGFAGTTEFKMKDFGMDYNLGPASETVYMDLHIEGIRQ
jgi:polyisoprenoid-binding protein YceI